MKAGKYISILIASITLLGLVCCKRERHQPDRAFYYWKSNFNLSAKDIAYLNDAHVSKLYIHFFDVAFSDRDNKPYPVDEVRFSTMPDKQFEYIPVVFIPNKTLEHLSADSIEQLSSHIYTQVSYLATANRLSYKELQFDCDWTETTRVKYFKLLTFFHDRLHDSGKILSATIRLHQVKYPDVTGIPPIDRGMLMFYNMGKINAEPGNNSIYNSKDANKYVTYVTSYPLPLDVALPVFSWAVCIRNGQANNIIEKAVRTDFPDSLFSAIGNNMFISRSSVLLHGRYFDKNDTVKMEEVTPQLCVEAANNVNGYLKDAHRTLSLFEYDSLYLSHYDKKSITQIFTGSN